MFALSIATLSLALPALVSGELSFVANTQVKTIDAKGFKEATKPNVRPVSSTHTSITSDPTSGNKRHRLYVPGVPGKIFHLPYQ